MNRFLRILPATVIGLGAVLVLFQASEAPAAQTETLFTGFQAKSDDPIQVDAGQLEISEEGDQRISVFSGNVIVRRGDTVLTAKIIRIFSDLNDNRPKNEAFSRIEASGNVEVKSGQQTVTGSKVVVDMGKQTITMSGTVVLKQGANVITGDRLVVDLATGKARVEQAAGKPIRGVFTPGSGNLSPGQ
jgi:lipopolysaccharide export system protein LptA